MRLQDFHSCFFSYSGQNQAFADFLYKDLQENKVLCWLATEGLKIGGQFRRKIEESILRHDKLLLILSHDSVKSTWVRSEVETAFEKEQRTGRSVLFPIRLDDTVMQSTQDWAAEIRRTRHIGDFRSWQDSEFYRKAFARLSRDLKGRADIGAPTLAFPPEFTLLISRKRNTVVTGSHSGPTTLFWGASKAPNHRMACRKIALCRAPLAKTTHPSQWLWHPTFANTGHTGLLLNSLGYLLC